MTAVTKRKPKKVYNKYVPTYDYSQVNNWSMSKEESNAILEEAGKLLDAGDEEGHDRLIKKLPLPPNMALLWRDQYGKEALLAEGCNLADAEIVYGKDWLDKYMVD
jgi:hypothetical protein